MYAPEINIYNNLSRTIECVDFAIYALSKSLECSKAELSPMVRSHFSKIADERRYAKVGVLAIAADWCSASYCEDLYARSACKGDFSNTMTYL